MPQFGPPFSGLANDRKLTDDQFVPAIRFMVAAEYEAVQLYMQLAGSTDNKLADCSASLPPMKKGSIPKGQKVPSPEWNNGASWNS
jgi:hypothetical protein